MRDVGWNAFQYNEVIETLFYNYLCGGDCLGDINMLAPLLALWPGTRIPNSATCHSFHPKLLQDSDKMRNFARSMNGRDGLRAASRRTLCAMSG